MLLRLMAQEPRVRHRVRCFWRRGRGQSVVEYLLIFGVVAAAITGMMVYAKRGIQGTLKTAAGRTRYRDGRHGQSSLEYALFAGVVAAALVAMAVYVRRAIQANLKVMESQTSVEPMKP